MTDEIDVSVGEQLYYSAFILKEVSLIQKEVFYRWANLRIHFALIGEKYVEKHYYK